jgi:Ser/Thr protein kinase RdoA (MazF antagonist)
MNTDSPDRVTESVAQEWNLDTLRFIGGRENKHWLVDIGGTRFVLRAYSREQTRAGSMGFELEILRRVKDTGWPVPEPVREPLLADERLWCLFTLLPGQPRSQQEPEEQRQRGRLLAELHESTASMTGLGQRQGWHLSDETILNPELTHLVDDCAEFYPREHHILRWHIERVREGLADLDLDGVEVVVLHGDFTCWNLLFEANALSGVLDFEAAHVNYRVADFALAWRGQQADVIRGYEEVHPLSDLDWQLLIPAYWAWLFIGVKEWIRTALYERRPTLDLDWQIKHMLRRSEFHGDYSEPYPGFQNGPSYRTP